MGGLGSKINMKHPGISLLIFFFLTATTRNFVSAQVYPADFGQVLVTNGISNPTVMAFAPDGRIFVAQQSGALRVIKNNTLLTTPFISLSVNSTGERGLIGIAIDPNFSTNNYIYLYYTVPTAPIHNRISRFTANGDVAQPNSEVVVLELDPLSGATNHNGGAMHFGLDGKLYVAIGENANSANAPILDTYHGKLLRINKDGTVPAGNPFTTGSEQRKRVWAYGLRNPYTFAIHPVTGRILVNDVGQNSWEEINDATTGGRNFGWPATEGYFTAADFPTLTNPIYVYPHAAGDGNGCAITGGTFFFPTTTNYPQVYVNRYFLQDLCNAWINSLDLTGANPVRSSFATGIGGNSLSLTTGIDGNLYFLSRNNSALYKIVYNNTTTPFIINQPASVATAEDQDVTFSVSALGSTPLGYQWWFNGSPVSGATLPSYTIADVTTANNGNYTVVVSNANGMVTSNAATLTVTPNTLPVANIITPAEGTTYVAGNSISFSGAGTDAEDGTIPAASLKWNINFHHNTHKHDEPATVGVNNGTFAIPVEGETSDNVWYRIILTVTDSKGMTGKDSVDIFPEKSTIDLVTIPSGLQLTLDGQPIETPLSVVSVEGVLRTIGIITPQTVDDVTYDFESWSNQGEDTQTVVTPTEDITFTARFSIVVGTESPDNRAASDEFSVYPNPSHSEEVTIHTFSSSVQPMKIRLVDVLARDIAMEEKIIGQGDVEFTFVYGKIKKGIYSIVIDFAGKSISRRLAIAD